MAIVPVHFAINHSKHPDKLLFQTNNIELVLNKVNPDDLDVKQKASLTLVKTKIDTMKSILTGLSTFKGLKKEQNFELRKDILVIGKETDNLLKQEAEQTPLKLSKEDKDSLKEYVGAAKGFTEYAPIWVIVIISISLGLGTMVGWKRIVVTIGEKIGKEHLTYAQGASAEIVAASTIAVSSYLKLPVSTTHVLSSGIAGSMVATKGIKNLRMKMIKNILIAWLVTLPVTILLAGGLFLLIRLFL